MNRERCILLKRMDAQPCPLLSDLVLADFSLALTVKKELVVLNLTHVTNDKEGFATTMRQQNETVCLLYIADCFNKNKIIPQLHLFCF